MTKQTPASLFEQLPEISPHLLHVTGVELVPGSQRTVSEDALIGELNQLSQLTIPGTVIVGDSLGGGGVTGMVFNSLRRGVAVIDCLAKADPESLTPGFVNRVGDAALGFLPKAIRLSISPSLDTLSRHLDPHAEQHVRSNADSYTALLPFAGRRLGRVIKRQLKSA